MAHPALQPVPAAVLTARGPGAREWAALAAVVCGLVVAWQMPHARVGVFYDDGIYAALAQSLAHGHGYRLEYLPGAPAAVHYPVLYPAFLAALWRLWPTFPANVALFRAANVVFMAAFAGLLAFYLARLVPARPWIAAIGTVLAVTSVPLVAVATVLFSEPLFLVLAVLACLAGDAVRTREGRGAVAMAALAGLLAGLAALTRSIGLSVVLGVSVAAWVAGKRAPAGVAMGVGALVLLPWMLWSGAHRGELDPVLVSNYGTYGQFLAQGGVRWISVASILGFVGPLGNLVLPGFPGPVKALLAIAVLIVLVVGFVVLLRRAPSAGWMMLAYLGIVALWPYGPDRFVWAALPWLLCAFAAGVDEVLRDATSSAMLMRGLGLVAAGTVALGLVPRQVMGLAHDSATATQRAISATFDVVVPWVKTSTDTTAVVAGEDEALLWLYTGRHAVPSYLWRVEGRDAVSFGPDTLRAFLTRSRATHVILTGPGSDAARTINELLGRSRGFLHPVQVWPGPMMAFAVWHPPADSAPARSVPPR